MMTMEKTAKQLAVMSIEKDADKKLEALAVQVENLKGEANLAKSSADVQSTINKLSEILSRIPLGLPGTAPLQAAVRAALAEAEKHKQEELAQEDSMFSAMMREVRSSMFCYGVCKHMTTQEKNFYDSFKAGQKYDVYEWRNGEYAPALNADGTAKTVDGASLKQAFADIKYHALNDGQKKETGAPPGAASETEQMDRLHKSLDLMEGHCRRGHDKFRKAHDQADKVKRLNHQVSELASAGEAKKEKIARLALKDAKDELRQTLQRDILDQTLVPSQARGEQMAQGLDISNKEAVSPTPGGSARAHPTGLTPS